VREKEELLAILLQKSFFNLKIRIRSLGIYKYPLKEEHAGADL